MHPKTAQMLARRAYDADAYLSNAPDILSTLFWTNADRESLPEARRWCEEGHRRFPDISEFTRCQLWLLVTPLLPADVDRALELRAAIDSLTESRYLHVEADLLVGGVLGRAEMPDSARSVFDAAHDAVSSEFDPGLSLYAREAYVRTLVGDFERAIDLLKQFTAANPTHDFSQLLGNWWWRELRQQPRWRELNIG